MSNAPTLRVITESLGGSLLSLAAQARQLPQALQPWSPAGTEEWRAHVERRRSAMPADWFTRLEGAINPGGAAADRLARVVSARGVVVTTGQQPGLFGGPLYTLSKALTALELANAIERTTGVAAAPVFWAATDDADFDEAKLTYVSDATGLTELAQTERPVAGTQMSDAPLGDVRQHVEQLRAACGSAPHAHFFDLAATAYLGGRTIGSAYVQLLRALLQPLGIAVLDASADACRVAARPVLAEALESAAAVAKSTAARAAAIRAAGFEPQVEDDRGLSLVFGIEKGLKRRLTIAESAGVAPSAILGPNVLLRPVVEREVLPTVAYVGGPGEIAYFTQADAVATALGRERLSVVPRWSCTVVEPWVERAMGRLDVRMDELKDVHALEKKLSRQALPPEVANAWKKLNEVTQGAVTDLAQAVESTGLMPPPVIEGLSRSIGHRLGRTERRLLAAVKRRDAATMRDVAGASAAIWPKGKRQERVLNFIPMLARSGEALLDEMRRSAAVHASRLVGVPPKA
jgi:uncharacterized protein YllA (UPF0747 family)